VIFCADFIYSEYLISGQSGCGGYRSMIYQISEDYACADLILRLPGHAPMPAFREVEDVPLVVRHARKSRQQVVMATSPSCHYHSYNNKIGTYGPRRSDAVQYSLGRTACLQEQAAGAYV